MTPHPLAERIADLFLRPGYLPHRLPDEINRERIRGEWLSGQWVMLTGPDDRLWGWLSWYRVNRDVLALLKADDAQALLARGDPADLQQGDYLYLATAVVTPWAPRGTYRALYRQACRANADAAMVCAHMIKRDGRALWHERRLHRGQPGRPDQEDL